MLVHLFKFKCHDMKSLLEGCNKLSTFCSRLERQSKLFPNRYDPEKYKGDGFELLVEALIKLSSIDMRIGISSYQPIQTNDTGVDGFGIGNDGEPATVQIKYRGKGSNQLLTSNNDHLSNFISTSTLGSHQFKVDPNTTTNLLVVTTAEGLHHYTDIEMFKGQVRCLGKKNIKQLIDNNNLFWDKFRELCGIL